MKVLCGLLIPASMVVDWEPSNDKIEARELMEKAAVSVRLDLLYADAGYDAECVHEHCVGWGVMGVIKPVKHQKEGPPGGLYRSQMTERTLKDPVCWTRWQVESFMSGMKRMMGSVLNAWTERGLMPGAALMVLAYAIRC